jgi:hypothetical protein
MFPTKWGQSEILAQRSAKFRPIACPLHVALTLLLLSACVNDAPPDSRACGESLDVSSPECPATDTIGQAAVDPSCVAPFDYITPAESTLKGPVVEIALDDTHVYFITLDHLYSVAREGGTLTRLFTRNRQSGSTLAALWAREHDLLVYQDAANVFAVPKAGGTATRLPKWDRMATGTLAARSGRVAIGWNVDSDLQGRSFREFWMLDVDTIQFSVIGRAPQPAGEDIGALDRGTLFWTDNPRAVAVETLLFSMPTSGGEASEVVLLPELHRRFALFGAAGGQLFLFGTNGGSEFQLLRAPAAGGEVEVLDSAGGQTEESLTQFAETTSGVMLSLHALEPGGAVQRDWVATASGHAQRMPCIAAREAPAFAIDRGELYSAVDARGGLAIVRRPLP